MRKDFTVKGITFTAKNGIKKAVATFRVQISKDDVGSTISIDNGQIMFTMPLKPIEEALINA